MTDGPFSDKISAAKTPGKPGIDTRRTITRGEAGEQIRALICEAAFRTDCPFPELYGAAELAKRFDDDWAPSFISGILNAVARDRGCVPETGKTE